MMRRREPLLGGALCFSAPSKGCFGKAGRPLSPCHFLPSLSVPLWAVPALSAGSPILSGWLGVNGGRLVNQRGARPPPHPPPPPPPAGLTPGSMARCSSAFTPAAGSSGPGQRRPPIKARPAPFQQGPEPTAPSLIRLERALSAPERGRPPRKKPFGSKGCERKRGREKERPRQKRENDRGMGGG